MVHLLPNTVEKSCHTLENVESSKLYNQTLSECKETEKHDLESEGKRSINGDKNRNERGDEILTLKPLFKYT